MSRVVDLFLSVVIHQPDNIKKKKRVPIKTIDPDNYYHHANNTAVGMVF